MRHVCAREKLELWSPKARNSAATSTSSLRLRSGLHLRHTLPGSADGVAPGVPGCGAYFDAHFACSCLA